MPIQIESEDDWTKVSDFGAVLDPMILRCGELFLSGSTGSFAEAFRSSPMGTPNSADVWRLLQENLLGLGTFFDRLVLEDQIPAFDYCESFAIGGPVKRDIFDRINGSGEVLVDVHVDDRMYLDIKSKSVDELLRLYGPSGYGVDMGEANSILGELATAGYIWYPDIAELPVNGVQERQLAGYILAGLVFGSYAQLAGIDHLMQPKRSRLFLATAFKTYGPRSEEQCLFDDLNKVTALRTEDIPFNPTFFPMLLRDSRNPTELLENALKLRESREVTDYRQWLEAALADYSNDGCIPFDLTREVKSILEAVKSKSEAFKFPETEFKIVVSALHGLPEAELGFNITRLASAAWGWFNERLPGRRYRKLLTRAIISNQEFAYLERRAERVWTGQG